ncbi:hypothetical protein E2493_06245 [Sphingomonas parva]|uniref:TrbI/VirB10 family protein n=1 Tax=Sphingomonas parva TaxID=2555898 RepID=A0A4Y8ZUY6_9SPHN|nr:hypothetical protein [Sphingomonas parva]TFI59122.1 hypothetical protein E2493_06245 [Sphingomonas parva]
MNILKTALLVSVFASASVHAQGVQPAPAAEPAPAVESAPAVQPAVIAVAPAAVEAVLPANTEVVLVANSIISSDSHRKGEKFSMSVAQDVKVEGRVVIPQGTRAVGLITQRTGKGGFGKSGKIDLGFRYIDLGGVRIPVDGRHHQEGNGKGAAAVGATLAVGVIGGLMVKGKNARIEEGREFTVRTVDAVPVTLAADSAPAVIVASYVPSKIEMTVETDKQRKAREKAERAQGKKAKK